jgi:acetolactate synthase regulatory subunit
MTEYSKVITLENDNDAKTVGLYLYRNKPTFCALLNELNSGLNFVTLSMNQAIRNGNINKDVATDAYTGLDVLSNNIKKLNNMLDPDGNCVHMPVTQESKKVKIETLNDYSQDVQSLVNEVLEKLSSYKYIG